MKKVILSLIIALCAVVANAQGFRQMNPEDMAKRQAERIKENCNTTDEQYAKIYDLYLAQSKQTQAMMDSIRAQGNNGGERPRFDREAMQKRNEEMNAKIKAILTEEQYAKYEEMQKQMRERRGQGGQRQRQN